LLRDGTWASVSCVLIGAQPVRRWRRPGYSGQGDVVPSRPDHGRAPMTRREFLGDTASGAVAGIAFVECGLAGGSGSAQAQTRRREVVVNGRRVKTIGVRADCSV